MISKEDMKLSKFVSLILRHKPEEINLSLDENGWVEVNKLINGINKKNFNINLDDLKRIVSEDNKQRYSFNSDLTKIRANQGHSIKVNLDLKEVRPPDILYHGSSKKFMKNIIKEGITKQKRQYVHLSLETETASKVGKRHGELIMFILDSKKMYEDGYKFYLSENGVWLTDFVPSKYIKFLGGM